MAFEFVDCLARAGIGLWQVLPLGPTGSSQSPYQSLSSFAGNPLLISLELLVEDELLRPNDLLSGPANTVEANYVGAADFKQSRLHLAYKRFERDTADSGLSREFEEFTDNEAYWLDDFAFFMAAKFTEDGRPWFAWKDRALSRHDEWTRRETERLLTRSIRFEKFCQFLFFRQWMELKRYAGSHNIRLMGDVPIYCAHDSADVWASREFFQLEPGGSASAMAGVPPDYFSDTGQLWGNPLYDWDSLEKDNYRWWLKRINATLKMVDQIRIDHFRGFEAYWAVAQGETTAVNGRWRPGPGQKFFSVLRQSLGDNLPIVAEDLGVITPRVDALRQANGLPGMKVLHFAFGGGSDLYLPHTYTHNTVCYSATHDNDTSRGWYDAIGPDYAHMTPSVIEAERDRARRYLGCDGSDIAWNLIRLALSSVADTAIIPMQDVLNLPNTCRMNRPGLGEGQWLWRLTREQLTDAPWGSLSDLVYLYSRQPVKPATDPVLDVVVEDK
jgi:4-alpha-glucanotransferase